MRVVVIFCCLVLSTLQAQAANNYRQKFYMGMSAGVAQISSLTSLVPENQHNSGNNIQTSDSDKGTTATHLFFGFNVNRRLSVEFGYNDYASFALSDTSLSSLSQPPETKLNINGFYSSIVGRKPVSDYLEIFAEAGYQHWQASLVEDEFDTSTTHIKNGDEFYSFGLNYNLTKLSYFVEYEITHINTEKIDSVNAGLKYRF